jgi:hypothetical protein
MTYALLCTLSGTETEKYILGCPKKCPIVGTGLKNCRNVTDGLWLLGFSLKLDVTQGIYYQEFYLHRFS